ncbi:MAG: DUF1800 domain-containing protein [Chloroflexi bacterium]|nr:DUF1800 domain-containing protein [Chloroflexota bacterium]
MRESAVAAETPFDEGLQVERVLTQGMGRRAFMVRAAAMGLTATALPAFLTACAQIDAAADGTPAATAALFPTPTPFRTPTVSATPSLTPTPFGTRIAPPTATSQPAQATGLRTELAKTSHLLRRAGFGASPVELERFVAIGLPATVDYLINYERVDDDALERRLATQELDLEQKAAHLRRWWLTRMIYSERPLLEKMTLFWHGLLTSSFKKAGKGPAMLEQNQLFREKALGRYDDLLKAVSRDPAMMLYLDSRTNRKRAPNENYSRELMELFSLGIGNYNENDVRESARAFTGWELRRKEFRLNAREHDSGEKTFLGKTGPWHGDDIVDIIMEQPAAGEYISRRLFEFFAYDDPEPEVVLRLAGIFRDSHTEIKPVVRAILTSEEFYSPRAARAKLKSPVELVASTLRTLSLETDGAQFLKSMDSMGQVLFEPPNVAGWPGGAAWINSSTLLERVNFANLIATARRQKLTFEPASLAGAQGMTSTEEQVGFFVDLLLGGEIPADERAILVAYMNALDSGLLPRDSSASLNEKLRSLVYLLLASPDYQVA